VTTHSTALPDPIQVPAGGWPRARRVCDAFAAGGLVLSAVGFVVNRAQFYHSWLTAFVFVLTVALGTLLFVMLQHITRAGWSVAIRRLAEVSASIVPYLLVLFVPIVIGMRELYPWARPDALQDPLIRHKHAYLNLPFFLIRAAIYFGIWTMLTRYFLRRSLFQDVTKDFRLTVGMQRRAAPGIILHGLALTFMAFDWLMSGDPHWYSTIFGVYVFAGNTLAAFAFLTLVAMTLRHGGWLRHTLRTDHFQDLGRFMFAFAVFWAYIAFAQFFLIWYGNMPEETEWYVHRIAGSWKAFSFFLAAGHFAVPFVLLMSRWVKRRPRFVAALAVWILFMHYLDMHWIVMPMFHSEGFSPSWIDLATLAGISGVFLSLFTRRLAAHALIPVGDPRLPESLALEHLY
jgi:hypothetical protein